MTGSAESKNEVPLAASIPEGAASLESILCTEELQQRPSRPPDYAKENAALVALASALAESRHTILEVLVETILRGTDADSSGLSLLTSDGASPDGDRLQLQQLVFSLALNAIEAMDPVVDRPKKLSICSKLPSPDADLVEVRDCGTGMKAPDRIFDAFFTTKENGMGMGLATCRSIIEAHRGRIWAASGEGEGSTFSFTLPVRASAA